MIRSISADAKIQGDKAFLRGVWNEKKSSPPAIEPQWTNRDNCRLNKINAGAAGIISIDKTGIMKRAYKHCSDFVQLKLESLPSKYSFPVIAKVLESCSGSLEKGIEDLWTFIDDDDSSVEYDSNDDASYHSNNQIDESDVENFDEEENSHNLNEEENDEEASDEYDPFDFDSNDDNNAFFVDNDTSDDEDVSNDDSTTNSNGTQKENESMEAIMLSMEKLSWNEICSMCKKHNVKARGTRKEIEEKIMPYLLKA